MVHYPKAPTVTTCSNTKRWNVRHFYPALHYLLHISLYLLALWSFLYLIVKCFISRSPPSPSPSHSAVLAHFSLQLISVTSSNSAFSVLPILSLNHFYLAHQLILLHLDILSSHSQSFCLNASTYIILPTSSTCSHAMLCCCLLTVSHHTPIPN